MRLLLPILLATVALHAQPRVQPFVLPNGLRVFHLEDHEHPLVRAHLQVDLRPADTPAGLEGLSALTLRMFQASASTEGKSDDFDLLLESSGIQLTREATPTGLAWQVVARSRDQDRALGLLAENILRTVFDPATVWRQAAACWRDQEPLGVPAQVRLRRALAVAPGEQPTQASLSAINLEDLIAFRSRVFRPERAVLAAALAEAQGRGATLGSMKALTLEALNAGLRSWLDPKRLRTGAAGPPEALAQLAPQDPPVK